jgi:hypothetical protein
MDAERVVAGLTRLFRKRMMFYCWLHIRLIGRCSTMPASVYFDHLAVGVRNWSEGFQRFAGELGGRWSHGGDAGNERS